MDHPHTGSSLPVSIGSRGWDQLRDLQPPGCPLNTTPSGNGYWEIDAAGNVFSYGDGVWRGGLSTIGVNATDVVSATTFADGYCMVEANGYYACFYSGGWGRAEINPSGPFNVLLDPATTITADFGSACGGYPAACGGWISDRQGHLYTYNGGVYEGGLGSVPNGPIMGSSGWGTTGYRLVGADGGIFSFGSLPFEGSNVVSSGLSSKDAQDVGEVMLPEGNWGTFNEWSNGLQPIWQNESGWRWNVCSGYPNGPYSYTTVAYGIPQALPGSKMCTSGPACPNSSAWQTNAWSQIMWGFWYIGVNPNGECCPKFYDPATAWQYWQTHHNYAPVG